MKLLNKHLKDYRKQQWERQDKLCPICEKKILEEEAVLDHNHDNGFCRMVLHRSCNTVEGKIKKSYIRYVSGKGISLLDTLKNLVKYLEKDYSKNPLHPKELTSLEKELKSINKKLKTLKRESNIIEYKERATELRVLIKQDKENNSWKSNNQE